jgi:type IV pilus assembly protein PilB
MSNINTIDDLINPKFEDDNDPSAKLQKRQKEIKIKEIEKYTKQKASQLGLPYIDLVGFPISPEAIVLLDEQESKKLNAICFFYNGTHIRLACIEPSVEIKEKLNELTAKYFCQGKLYLISNNSFEYALEIYKSVPKIKTLSGGVEIKEEDLEKFKSEINDFKKLGDIVNKVNISQIVTLLLATAIKIHASDIHIESEEKSVAVRFRVDGVLQEATKIDKKQWKKIISRMKILAGVKINIDNKPQDGRYTIFLKNGKIDVRSSFLPTAYGESVVMRLLDSSSISLEFENLGLRPQALNKLKQEISKPNGLILTTGPTGSGKTTTLYSVLNKLNKPGTKIITLEDPIEYQLPGINQSQVDISKGYSFAKGLRSILRQDPNIIMVGEIRDLETAEISIQASLTGHLVLSTLHTNDAAGVIPRLIDIGVKPYFLVPSINAVIGQRLVRKLCPACKKVHALNEEEKEQVQKILGVISPKAGLDVSSELKTVYKAGEGCEKCNGLAYKGRLGIYEIFTMNDEIKQLTVDKAPAFKILKQAIENGMITMLQDGILKCLEGITSLEEVYRVIGNFDYINELYDNVISETIGRGIKINQNTLNEAKKLSVDIASINNKADKSSSNKIIETVLALSITSNAGDIHIEPGDKEVKVRFRIDGTMHDVLNLSKNLYLSLIAELKILAGFATNIKRATLDGRFSIHLPDQKIDCRLSIIAGGYGETVVIRLLNQATINLSLEELGIMSKAKKTLDRAISKTKGIILTTGPTGSGKTTTLYGLLNKLNNPDTKIITIEDPIEYNLSGVIQTQIDSKKGYTFAAAMRSLLRQNPNIMMIGEIRDSETAETAIEAAMTGHLVLSTLHANSAAGAISRLIGLDISKQLLAGSIECSIGQRLVRKICPHCKEEISLSKEEEKEVENIINSIPDKEIYGLDKKVTFYQGAGCQKCNQIGYKGRLGIYEVMEINSEIKKLIQSEQVIESEIESLAIKNGMLNMLQDGIIKASQGYTSIKEIFKVLK